MYFIADHTDPPPAGAQEDPVEREIQEIEDLRERALASRDILYCSTAVRHLVEREIPRLVEIIRKLRSADDGDDPAARDLWMLRALAELRKEVQVVRDLVERK